MARAHRGSASAGPLHDAHTESGAAPAAPVIQSDPTTDAALIARVRRGDVGAFATVVHRHMRSAFGIAFHVLQHRQDAEDAVQGAFMAALSRLDTYDSARPFGPWFGRVVLNHARSARRSRDRLARRWAETGELVDASLMASPERRVEDAEVRERVRAALGILPERQRLAIQLIEIEGYSPADVAAMLEVTPVTMRWHLMAARRKLRRLLAPLAPRVCSGGPSPVRAARSGSPAQAESTEA